MFSRFFSWLFGFAATPVQTVVGAALADLSEARKTALAVLPTLSVEKADRVRELLDKAENLSKVIADVGVVAGQPQAASLALLVAEILSIINSRR